MKCSLVTVMLLAHSFPPCFAFVSQTLLSNPGSPTPNYRAAATLGKEPATIESSVEGTASELLALLLDSRKRNEYPTNEKDRIDALVTRLVESRSQFDPKISLNAPMWTVCYRTGPTPLWGKLGLTGPRNNLQGQQYRYSPDGEKSVINYAEIFGKGLHLRAYGTYKSESTSGEDSAQKTSGGLLTCPVDFTVQVTKGSICLGKSSFDIPIAGTGYLRVLYANSDLRIFVSPKDTTDDRWEKEGLVVVQVRSDLVGPSIDLYA